MYKNCDCAPTYLVNSIVNNGGVNYLLNFKTVPTLLNGNCIKFRLADSISTVAAPGLPIFVNANVNGAVISVPLRDCIGNNVRTGDDLKTRTTYTAIFGSDTNHLQIVKVNGCPCLKV